MGAVEHTVAALSALVGKGGVLVLSGAGLSTESGIPDYRGPSGMRRNAQPMTYQTFTRDPIARRRYWARSHLGWRTIARAAPNAGHRAVGRLQARGLLSGIITQNVDGLHQAGGADGIIELHGALDRVACLDCGERSGRAELDARLAQANAGFTAEAGGINPDGDVDLTDEQAAGFVVVGCTGCGGMLKPDVVFFGESVPAPRVRDCFELVERSAALVVLGSSLTVMSGRRFVVRAAKLGLPIAIVNQGPTRADALAGILLDAPLGAVLSSVAWTLR
ncbi:NAD-dependent protein deacetylase [Dactylosporangium sp. NPDC051485]|uniref:NAD-dependent protein deacetylase n=1 Tax=Dactylosporangium sp. NPDC051485 TaxID=3154846 RepID=UPI003417270E